MLIHLFCTQLGNSNFIHFDSVLLTQLRQQDRVKVYKISTTLMVYSLYIVIKHR